MLRNPEMLLWLPLVLLAVLWMIRARRLDRAALRALRGEQEGDQPGLRRDLASCGWVAAALTALVLALAQPVWNPRTAPGGLRGRDVVVALDISRSMLAADVFPSRLEASKIALYESLEALRGQRIGLVTFAGSAAVRVPLTLDHFFVRMMIERASPYDAEVGSTSLQAAIEKALDIVLRDSERGRQDVILITDGEDHLSDPETLAERLRESEARILIIGLGDAETGARIPASGDEGGWMTYRGEEVFTRLDDALLTRLDQESPHVFYYRAGTRPFDLVEIYSRFLAQPGDRIETDEGAVIYTEGAPFLLLAALILYAMPRILLPVQKRVGWIALLLCATACTPHDPDREEFERLYDAGRSAWVEAQLLVELQPEEALAIMGSAREQFLRAALLLPGNANAAGQIAGITGQMEAVRDAIEEQRREQQNLQELLQEAARELAQLVQRQRALSNESRRILRQRPPVPPEERREAAAVAHEEQNAVQDATGNVQLRIDEARSIVHTLLRRFIEEAGELPPTELDEVIDLLDQAIGSQQTAASRLAPDTANWQQASPPLQVATRQMQEALDLLQQAPDTASSGEPGEFDEDGMEWDYDEYDDYEAGEMSDSSMPMRAESYEMALESQSLPEPDYSAEEILMQEEENQQMRSQRRGERAGAQVEKNW